MIKASPHDGADTKVSPPQARAKTPTFTDKERAVIANLDSLEVRRLKPLSEPRVSPEPQPFTFDPTP